MNIKQFLKREEHVCKICDKFVLFPTWIPGIFNKMCDECLRLDIENSMFAK